MSDAYEKDFPVCPKCSGYIPSNENPGAYPGAISRADNKTEICSACGVAEAVADYLDFQRAKLVEQIAKIDKVVGNS